MIRKLRFEDRQSLSSILHRTEQFRENEVDVALELIDCALSDEDQQDYHVYIYEENQTVCGYFCIGLRPLTDGVYDLYWIVVSPEKQNSGIGTCLIKEAENFVRSRDGRWLLIETSSKDDYSSTRKFYLKNGFEEIVRIKDFYSLGDALVTYGKYFMQ